MTSALMNISSFTEMVRDISFKCFDKTVKVQQKINSNHGKKSEWFDDECKETKAYSL